MVIPREVLTLRNEKKKFVNISPEEKQEEQKEKEFRVKTLDPITAAYLAGFIDGDGSILAQLVKRKGYRYHFQVRVQVLFFQKTKRN